MSVYLRPLRAQSIRWPELVVLAQNLNRFDSIAIKRDAAGILECIMRPCKPFQQMLVGYSFQIRGQNSITPVIDEPRQV